MPSGVQVGRTTLDGLIRHRHMTRRWHDRFHRTLDHVLIEPAPFVEHPQPRFDLVHESVALLVGQPFVVDAADRVHQTHVTGLRQEHVVVDEAPERDQLIQAAGVVVVAKDAGEFQHADTSTFTRRCLPGS